MRAVAEGPQKGSCDALFLPDSVILTDTCGRTVRCPSRRKMRCNVETTVAAPAHGFARTSQWRTRCPSTLRGRCAPRSPSTDGAPCVSRPRARSRFSGTARRIDAHLRHERACTVSRARPSARRGHFLRSARDSSEPRPNDVRRRPPPTCLRHAKQGHPPHRNRRAPPFTIDSQGIKKSKLCACRFEVWDNVGPG
jgi:hypothetical protein